MSAPPDTAVEVTTGCILFTDLVGFTEYNDVVGDQAAVEVLDRQTALARTIVDGRENARIVKELGDGLMLWFGAARDALERAVALLAAIEAARSAGDFPLAVRMGLHHGEMLPRGDDLVGITVNIAARIAELAGPGELLASEATLDAGGEFTGSAVIEPVGPAPVKGVSDPVWLVRLSTA